MKVGREEWKPLLKRPKPAEQELRQAEEVRSRLASIVENSSDAIDSKTLKRKLTEERRSRLASIVEIAGQDAGGARYQDRGQGGCLHLRLPGQSSPGETARADQRLVGLRSSQHSYRSHELQRDGPAVRGEGSPECQVRSTFLQPFRCSLHSIWTKRGHYSALQ